MAKEQILPHDPDIIASERYAGLWDQGDGIAGLTEEYRSKTKRRWI